jgi:hypothetical protein
VNPAGWSTRAWPLRWPQARRRAFVDSPAAPAGWPIVPLESHASPKVWVCRFARLRATTLVWQANCRSKAGKNTHSGPMAIGVTGGASGAMRPGTGGRVHADVRPGRVNRLEAMSSSGGGQRFQKFCKMRGSVFAVVPLTNAVNIKVFSCLLARGRFPRSVGCRFAGRQAFQRLECLHQGVQVGRGELTQHRGQGGAPIGQ